MITCNVLYFSLNNVDLQCYCRTKRYGFNEGHPSKSQITIHFKILDFIILSAMIVFVYNEISILRGYCTLRYGSNGGYLIVSIHALDNDMFCHWLSLLYSFHNQSNICCTWLRCWTERLGSIYALYFGTLYLQKNINFTRSLDENVEVNSMHSEFETENNFIFHHYSNMFHLRLHDAHGFHWGCLLFDNFDLWMFVAQVSFDLH